VTVTPGHNGSFPAGAPKKLRSPDGVIDSDRLLLAPRYPLKLDGVVALFRATEDFAVVELENDIASRAPRYTCRFLLKGKIRKESVDLPRLSYWAEDRDFEIRATTAAQLDGQDIVTTGYPVKKPDVKAQPNRQWMRWRAEGHVNNALRSSPQPGKFYHTAMTTSGQSGSSIWIEERRGGSTVRVMVGIAVASRQDHSYGVGLVLTESVLGQIEQFAPKTFRFQKGRLSVRT
jgi:hypothetical protein